MRFEGSSPKLPAGDRALGAFRALSDPPVLNSPVNGAGIPPNASQGDPARRRASDWLAAAGVTASGRLAPSIRTSPDSPRAPARPPKSHVA